jgi:hypothetical protein
VIARSRGESACLLGKTWGYDATGVWVSDGCEGEFVGPGLAGGGGDGRDEDEIPRARPQPGLPDLRGREGPGLRQPELRPLPEPEGLDATYVDAFGRTQTVKQREDVQLNKFFLPFAGWFLTPKFRYYLYVWSSNASQGDPAQVVGGGNLTYSFNRHVAVGGGITSLPAVRSTEGQFPYWLNVDDRLIADEFFRGSYTSGLWLKGEVSPRSSTWR